MKCSWSDIDLGWRDGTIDNMVKEAIEIAKLLDTRCSFEFNGVTVAVNKNSNWETLSKLAKNAVADGNTKYVSGQ
jgi:hypothetical protein